MKIKKENIIILSRNQIEELALSPFPLNTALISVRDTGDDAPELKYKPLWLLQLVFDDISSDELEDYKEQEYTLFNEQTAQQIADFLHFVRCNNIVYNSLYIIQTHHALKSYICV